MVKIFIDEKPVEAVDGMTILKAAETAGIRIPHFCYFKAFIPEGTCRMCLVEIEGLPKLELACSTQVREGMKAFTQSERVVEARKGVLEFLLAEHPLDCPICDQAGDCKLQDYYEEFGLFENQFSETKDKHEKKVRLGKNLIHDQERCILCRRCVRFLSEVTKTQEMGVFERGAHTEVNIYDGQQVDNNYSGNLAQLCPVGAITDIDFRFKTRSWFLEKGESICPLCSRGCSVFVEHHPGFSRFELPKRVYRISARDNETVNQYWICNRGRYGYSYLDENRAVEITSRNGEPDPSWDSVIALLSDKLKQLHSEEKTSRISLILNAWLSNEELFLIKKIFRDDLKANNIYFVGPPDGDSDEFLMTSDRSPNTRGASEIGFEIAVPDLNALAQQTDLLLIFGSFLLEKYDESDLKACFENIETKILFSPYKDGMTPLVDVAAPAAQIGEKGGSFTNLDGIVQNIKPVLPAVSDSPPEWKMLADLGRELAINFDYYRQLSSPEDIFRVMSKEIPFFEK